MNRKSRLIVLAMLAGLGMGFSPYEQHLRSGKPTHVGLIAGLKDAEAFATAVAALRGREAALRLEKEGIRHLQVFTRNIEGNDYAVIYFSYKGGMDYLGAAEVFEKVTVSTDWGGSVTPHPRAIRYGRTWLQMEWINYIRGLDAERKPASSMMAGTILRPEKEREYRTLHQTVWPGVVDQIVRSNSRNLCIFLIELDGLLVEFLYVEYMGSDQEKDSAASKADPITLRWWKLTDACQKPFSDFEDGIWAPLERLE